MKNVLIISLLLVVGVCPVSAEWVNVQDIKDPIRLLDTKSIKDVSYKDNEGVIFALRYIGKNNKENVATFFADFKNEKAGVISIKPYFKDMKYDFIIPNNFEMKDISEFKTNFLEIEKYAKGRKVEQSPTVEYLKEETAEKTGEQSKINWNPYITNIEKSIKKNWHPPKADKSTRAVVFFNVAKDGGLLECKIQQSSKNYAFDDAILRAIKETAPFRPLPKEFEKDFISIEFTFDYNVLGGTFNPKVSPNNTWHGRFLKGNPI